MLDYLGGDPDIDDLVLIHPGHARFRFQVSVVTKRDPVGIFNNDIGRRKAGLHVALADLKPGDDIALAFTHPVGAGF